MTLPLEIAKGAAFGAACGLGLEYYHNRNFICSKGFQVTTIAGAALKAVSYLFGWGCAVGGGLGFIAYKISASPDNAKDNNKAMVASFMGAAVGYLTGPVLVTIGIIGLSISTIE